ncbi:MAG: TonB-dependent receptor, partial [Bacteroidota bacterium]
IVSAAVSNTLLAHSAAVRTVTVITGVTNVTDIGRDCSAELFWLLLVLFFQGNLLAQQSQVNGTVSDALGQPLPGATIVEQGTNNGTQTDFDGNFSIQVQSPNAVLLISYIGFAKKEVAVDGRSQINVTLEEDATGLDEVVLIGYGGVRKSDLTGSVASVTSDDIQRTVNQSFQEALEGRAAGVQVLSGEGTPGGDVTIRVRGGTSISASNDPLYVIDGFPIIADASEVDNSTGITAATATSNPLSGIDPNDIESIEILKDASATAIYGSRGANGVIIVNTKKGQTGRSKLTFNTYSSIQQVTQRLDLLDPVQYAEWRLRYVDAVGNEPTETDMVLMEFLDGTTELETFDHQDDIFRSGTVLSYNLGLSGGSKDFQYNVTGGAFFNKGIIETSSFDRYNIRGNFNGQMSEKLSYNAIFSLAHTIQKGVPTGGGNQTTAGVITHAQRFPPIRLADESEEEELSLLGAGSNDRNPRTTLENTPIENRTDLAQANLSLDYAISDDLVFRILGGYNLRSVRNARYAGSTTGGGFVTNGTGSIAQTSIRTWLNENTLTYKKTLGVHDLTVLGGFTMQGSDIESFTAESNNFDIETLGFNNLGIGSDPVQPQSLKENWGIVSFLSRVNYSYDDRFLITASIRADGSSRFAEGEKWGYFPSAAVAWKIKNESFLENVDPISALKLRVGYGETGNQEVPRYQSASALGINFYTFGDSQDVLVTGAATSRVANPDLSWETTKQINAGLDFGFFRNRISGSVDYYLKTTEDMLLGVRLNPTTGIGQPALQNIGSLENEGIEIALNTINVETDNFSWATSINLATNRNEIESLGNADQILFDVRGGWHQIINEVILKPGESVGTFWGLESAGILGQDDNGDPLPLEEGFVAPGGVGTRIYLDRITEDTDGDGIADARDGVINADDRTVIGKGIPDFFGGFTNNFSYRGFSLNAFFDFQFGHDIYNAARVYSEELHNTSNRTTAILDAWTPENQDTEIPAIGQGDFQTLVDRYIEDASFIRLKNVTLSYDFNPRFLDKTLFSALRVYVSGQNLWTHTDYTGFNPQASTIRNPIAPGVDWGAYPVAKIYTIGLNATF